MARRTALPYKPVLGFSCSIYAGNFPAKQVLHTEPPSVRRFRRRNSRLLRRSQSARTWRSCEVSIDQNRQRWIEVGKVLSRSPSAKVLCPECGDAYLVVREQAMQTAEDPYEERIIECPKCGAWTSVLTRVPRSGAIEEVRTEGT